VIDGRSALQLPSAASIYLRAPGFFDHDQIFPTPSRDSAKSRIGSLPATMAWRPRASGLRTKAFRRHGVNRP
jgi:hypothetical protein